MNPSKFEENDVTSWVAWLRNCLRTGNTVLAEQAITAIELAFSRLKHMLTEVREDFADHAIAVCDEQIRDRMRLAAADSLVAALESGTHPRDAVARYRAELTRVDAL